MEIRIVLLEPEKTGNIGAIARSMKNFDLRDLWIVNPRATIDSESRAYAMRGRGILSAAKIVETLNEALKGVDVVAGTSAVVARSSSNIQRLAITPRQLAKKVGFVKGTTAIVFGRESSGLSNREVDACDFIVKIPASDDYNVLNVATAASIVFYELFQSKAPKELELASAASKRRLLLQFDLLMRHCGIQPYKRRLAHRAFRNVVSRSFISSREATLLLGVLRRALLAGVNLSKRHYNHGRLSESARNEG